MTEQQFEDYKSKYLDLYDKVKSDYQKEKVSILEDVDFELELIHRDEINVAYIIQLLIKLKSVQTRHALSQQDANKAEQEILNLLNTETTLRSKRELIEKFIKENLPVIEDSGESSTRIRQLLERRTTSRIFKNNNRRKTFPRQNGKTNRGLPLRRAPPFARRSFRTNRRRQTQPPTTQKLGDRILKRIMDFVETFMNGMAG